MNMTITGTNIEVTEALKDYIKNRAERLYKYFYDEVDIKVMYTSIDYAFSVVERQIIKYKNKIIDKKRVEGSSFKKDFINEETENFDINILNYPPLKRWDSK